MTVQRSEAASSPTFHEFPASEGRGLGEGSSIDYCLKDSLLAWCQTKVTAVDNRLVCVWLSQLCTRASLYLLPLRQSAGSEVIHNGTRLIKKLRLRFVAKSEKGPRFDPP